MEKAATATASTSRGEAQSFAPSSVTLFCCGDFMSGRGVDQILPVPSHPELHETAVKDARGYVALAEEANGPLLPKDRPDFTYVWGDALPFLERMSPDLRLINLETAVTTCDDWWKHKGINYRMHPGNISILSEAMIDICALGNNHVLDWGYDGLAETLLTLQGAGIKTCGAGGDLEEATAPAIKTVPGKGRVLVFSYGAPSSGVPFEWAASPDKPGVALLDIAEPQLSVQAVKRRVKSCKQAGDVVVLSIHWGANWGYTYLDGLFGRGGDQVDFAHRLIDECNVDVIHGHSSHHVKGIEVYKGKLILYGCGDFLNDYEGISHASRDQHEYHQFRDDLSLMYFITVDVHSGALQRLDMKPTTIKHLRVNTLSLDSEGAEFLAAVLNREGAPFGTSAAARSPQDDDGGAGLLTLAWGGAARR